MKIIHGIKVGPSALVSELKVARLFTSQDESRYVLNGVLVEVHPDKTLLVATDSRRIVILRSEARSTEDPPAEAARFIIPNHLIDMIVPNTREDRIGVTNRVELTYDTEANHVKIDHHIASGYIVSGQCIDGNYPNWHQIIPTGEPEAMPRVYLNCQFLADYAKAVELLCPENPTIGMVQHSQPKGPWVIQLNGAPNFFSVLMPMKSEGIIVPKAPAWLGLKSEPKAEVAKV